MKAVLASRYHDDEPGSPWTFALFVDARGDQRQRQAIAEIFTGRLGGTPRKQFPWVFKDANLLGVEVLDIEIDHTPGRGWFRAAGKVEVRVRQPVPDQETVTCVIPGHDRQGRSSSATRSRSRLAHWCSRFGAAAPTSRHSRIHPRMDRQESTRTLAFAGP